MTDKQIIALILQEIEKAFKNSAYWQHLEYAASDGKSNWLSIAREAIKDVPP